MRNLLAPLAPWTPWTRGLPVRLRACYFLAGLGYTLSGADWFPYPRAAIRLRKWARLQLDIAIDG